MRKSALLEFGNADVIEHRSKKRVKVFHERGEILLEYSNNEVRSIIRRLAWEKLRGYFRPARVGGKSDEEGNGSKGLAKSEAIRNVGRGP